MITSHLLFDLIFVVLIDQPPHRSVTRDKDIQITSVTAQNSPGMLFERSKEAPRLAECLKEWTDGRGSGGGVFTLGEKSRVGVRGLMGTEECQSSVCQSFLPPSSQTVGGEHLSNPSSRYCQTKKRWSNKWLHWMGGVHEVCQTYRRQEGEEKKRGK